MDTDSLVLQLLISRHIPWSWIGFSTLDRYYQGGARATSFGTAPGPPSFETIAVASNLTQLAACGLELAFPGIDGVDCILSTGTEHQRYFAILVESLDHDHVPGFFPGMDGGGTDLSGILDSRLIPPDVDNLINPRSDNDRRPDLLRLLASRRRGPNRDRGVFRLRPGVYDSLRSFAFLGFKSDTHDGIEIPDPGEIAYSELLAILFQAALLGRYSRISYGKHPLPSPAAAEGCEGHQDSPSGRTGAHLHAGVLPPTLWRYFLDLIISGNSPDIALDYLSCRGVLGMIAPELESMKSTDHHKDHHPEGNVWRHSLECLKYRKSRDLRLSYALLLHDSGKALAGRSGGKRFYGHAQIGRDLAKKLLARIGFEADFTDDVGWLVENHGYPSALTRLPSHRTDPLMADPRFPLLLELYRSDISASFSGPENYYAACDVYNRFRKDAGLRRIRFE